MNYLSEMLRLPVIDAAGEKLGVVNDLGIATGEVFPHVTSLAFQGPGKTPFMISWRKYVDHLDDTGVYLKAVSTDVRFSYLQPDEVLLARDILNKQIVDTQGMKVVRVNDIKLSATGAGQLRLLGAEVGARGLLRAIHPAVERTVMRLAKLTGRPLKEEIIAWSYMDLLERSTQTIKLSVSHKTLDELHPADIADIIEQLDPRLRGQVFAQLDTAQAAEAISELDDDELVAEMLEGMSDRDASSMLALMDPDDAAALIEELDYEKAEKLLRLMGVKEERAIRTLLGYAEDTAGRIMTQEFVALPATATVGDAIDAIRRLDEDFESVYYVYTLDPVGALTGVLSLRTLIVADRDARLSELSYRDVVWVAPDLDQEEVADEMTKYNLVAIPVCDEARHVLGIVTVDDALDVLAEEHEEDLQIAGMGSGESGAAGESMHALSWFAQRSYWVLVWAIASGVIAAVLTWMGVDGSSWFIYPMGVMPVVLITASRMTSFVRGFYLEYDEREDEGKPYLAFFLRCAGVGAVLALVVYLCGQLVLGAAFPEGSLEPVFVGGAWDVTAQTTAQVLTACFGAAAAVVFVCFLGAVGYLKLLFWRDEHDRNTSGIALNVSAVLIACVLYAVAATLGVFLVVA